MQQTILISSLPAIRMRKFNKTSEHAQKKLYRSARIETIVDACLFWLCQWQLKSMIANNYEIRIGAHESPASVTVIQNASAIFGNIR